MTSLMSGFTITRNTKNKLYISHLSLPYELILYILGDYFDHIPDIIHFAQVCKPVYDILNTDTDFFVRKMIENNKLKKMPIAYLIKSVQDSFSKATFGNLLCLYKFFMKHSNNTILENTKKLRLYYNTELTPIMVKIYYILHVRYQFNHDFAMDSCDLSFKQLRLFISLFDKYNINDAYFISKNLDEEKIQLFETLISRNIAISDALNIAHQIESDKIELCLNLIGDNFDIQDAINITRFNEEQYASMLHIIERGVPKKYAHYMITYFLEEEHINQFLLLFSIIDNTFDDVLVYDLIVLDSMETLQYFTALINMGFNCQDAIFLARNIFNEYDINMLHLYIEWYHQGITDTMIGLISEKHIEENIVDNLKVVLELVKMKIDPIIICKIITGNLNKTECDQFLELFNAGINDSIALDMVMEKQSDENFQKTKMYTDNSSEYIQVYFIIRNGHEEKIQKLLSIGIKITDCIRLINNFLHDEDQSEFFDDYFDIIKKLTINNISINTISTFLNELKRYKITEIENIWRDESITQLISLIINQFEPDIVIYIFKLGIEYLNIIININKDFIKNILDFNKIQMNIFLNLVKLNISLEKSYEYVLSQNNDNIQKIMNMNTSGWTFKHSFELYNKGITL